MIWLESDRDLAVPRLRLESDNFSAMANGGVGVWATVSGEWARVAHELSHIYINQRTLEP